MADKGEVSRKRHSASMASAAESSKNKRSKKDPAVIREDAEALNRNLQRKFGAPASISASAQILQGNSDSVSGLVQKFQIEISDLHRQQAIDRADFEAALNTHDEELEEIRNTLKGHRQGEMPSQDPLTYSESEESTVKSENDDTGADLYNATPQPREMPRIRADDHIAAPNHATFEEDMNLPTITEVTIKLYDGMRMPEVINSLPPILNLRLPEQPNESFNFDFLRKVFGGKAVASGWYVMPPKSKEVRLFPNVKSFRTVNTDYNPLVPRFPGAHGAQLSRVLGGVRKEILNFSLFIRRGQGGYKYYGTYKEPRFSDCLGGDEMKRVPEYVKQHWASQIGATPRHGKILRYNETIRDAWPKVPLGWLSDNDKVIPYEITPYGERLKDNYVEKPVTRRITDEEADKIGEEDILEAFETVSA